MICLPALSICKICSLQMHPTPSEADGTNHVELFGGVLSLTMACL